MYSKEATSIEHQIKQLSERGLEINEADNAAVKSKDKIAEEFLTVPSEPLEELIKLKKELDKNDRGLVFEGKGSVQKER